MTKYLTAKIRTALPLLFVPLCAALLTGCASVPKDGADAKFMRFDNLRNVRYSEVFLIGGNGLTKNLHAGVYNTTGLNDNADPKNSCPQDMWDKVDTATLKKQYHVLGVFKNGPRYWTPDWINLPVGAERDFDGLKARWFADVNLPKNINVHEKGSSAYKVTTVARKSQMGFLKGRPIFILDDPQGNPWVMQAYSLIVDPGLTYDSLNDLGSKLRLPPGWEYRVQILNQDLEIQAVDGMAHIMQDDLENTYDLCADGSSNYKP